MERAKKVKEFKHASVFISEEVPGTAIVEATANYIPLERFKEIFEFIGEIAVEYALTKLVFDKRKLSVFHQPSMEWYFVEWKEKMFEGGEIAVIDTVQSKITLLERQVDRQEAFAEFSRSTLGLSTYLWDSLMHPV